MNLIDEHAQLGKIANNLEIHGDEEMIGFAIPFTAMVSQEQLDALMGKYFHRSLYNTDAATQLQTPMDGFRRCKPLELEDVYEKAKVTIGDELLEHEFEDCKVSKISLEPQVGGLTKVRGQIYLRPGIGDENLWLQERQNTEVGLVIADGKIAAKKNPAQQSLPLPPPGDKPAASDSNAEFAAAAGAQVAAFNAKGGEVIDGRSERVKHQDKRKGEAA